MSASENQQTIKDQYIVVFKKEITSAIFQNQIAIAKANHKVKYTYEHALKGFSAELNSHELLKLRSNPFVQYIEGDQVVSLAQSTCSSQEAGSWGLTRISQHEMNIDGSYFASRGQGAGVDAYVLDTGVRITHNEFSGRATFGFKAQNGWVETDRNGHGTHVASTVAGLNYGVAKSANIISVKVLDDLGSGSFAGIIAGINYVIEQHTTSKKNETKKSVANLSLGGGRALTVNAAVDKASEMGVVVVVAAGNSNDNACDYSPASAKSAITVGATNIGPDSDVRSFFSNYGNCVDLLAPGSDITGAWWQTDTEVRIISGTSQASPHVAGTAALLLGDATAPIAPANVKSQLNGMSNKGEVDLLCSIAKPRKQSICEETPNALLFNGCSA